MKAIFYGLLAAMFFSITFILNRSMELNGGSWEWSASLRFFFMLPLLLILNLYRHNLRQSLRHLTNNFQAYLIWSTVGFGLFYAPLTYASKYSPGWLVASSWQMTIIAGSLLIPWLPTKQVTKRKIPWKQLRWSSIILLGVFFTLWDQATNISFTNAILSIIPVIFAAFMYPLGNRQMMFICDNKIDTFGRVLNMTIASMPFWLLLSVYAIQIDGFPEINQIFQSFLVALFSGIIATLFFFEATRIVQNDHNKLSTIEATQSGEVAFALIGELLLLNAPLPSKIVVMGFCLIIVGIIIQSFYLKA